MAVNAANLNVHGRLMLPVKKDFKYAKYYEMAVEGLNNELLQTQH
jgi:hypothetical protein